MSNSWVYENKTKQKLKQHRHPEMKLNKNCNGCFYDERKL